MAKASAISAQASTAVYHNVSRTRTELSMASIPPFADHQLVHFVICLRARTLIHDACLKGVSPIQHRFFGVPRFTYTSIKLENGSNSSSQTCSAISARPTTRPAFRAINSSKAYSFAVSEIARPSRVTFCPTVSTTKIGDHQFRWQQAARSPQQCPQPRQKLPKFEWLGQVVVSPVIETSNAIIHCVARRQHQNGHALSGLPQFLTNRKAVGRRDHHIEDGEVVAIDRGLVKGFFSRAD